MRQPISAEERVFENIESNILKYGSDRDGAKDYIYQLL